MSSGDIEATKLELVQCVHRLPISAKDKRMIIEKAERKLNIWIVALGGEIEN